MPLDCFIILLLLLYYLHDQKEVINVPFYGLPKADTFQKRGIAYLATVDTATSSNLEL